MHNDASELVTAFPHISYDFDIKPLLPKVTYMHYVDRSECFSSKAIQKSIHEKCWEPLDNEIDIDSAWENSIKELKNEMIDNFVKTFNLSEDDAEALYLEYIEGIETHFSEVDKSQPFKELLNNVGSLNMFYDTGYEMDSDSWSWRNAKKARECEKILKHLGYHIGQIRKIRKHHPKFWNAVWNIVDNAGYGGSLEIYFKTNPEVFIDLNNNPDEMKNHVRFKGCGLGVVNHLNGSGYVENYIKELDVIIPYNPENVFVDEKSCVSYSWCTQICGDSMDEADLIEFIQIDNGKTVEGSTINAHLKQQEIYDKVYRAGGCSPGDMNILRHRRVNYINNFPCGSKCENCGTFWID